MCKCDGKYFIVPTFNPHLDLLRQALGNHVQDCHAELVKTTLGWSRVYRVTLSEQGHSKRVSIIVKGINPSGPLDAREAEREPQFYRYLYRTLDIPKLDIHFIGVDEPTGWFVIIMQDLALTHCIPTHPHQWSPDELGSVLRAYAQLHTNLLKSLDYPWLAPRHESLLNFDKIPDQVETVQRLGIWGELPEIPDLIDYARESCRKYADEKLTLLHGDTTPTNAPIPKSKHGPATLIDWQDVGVGMPEFDLAYLDLQPFDSARLIPRRELLSSYWHFRARIEPEIPSYEERRERQLHADVVTALWLTAPASRVALHPYPEGTYPHMHWASQYRIVYNRLRELGSEI